LKLRFGEQVRGLCLFSQSFPPAVSGNPFCLLLRSHYEAEDERRKTWIPAKNCEDDKRVTLTATDSIHKFIWQCLKNEMQVFTIHSSRGDLLGLFPIYVPSSGAGYGIALLP